jgi:hypothetical protein
MKKSILNLRFKEATQEALVIKSLANNIRFSARTRIANDNYMKQNENDSNHDVHITLHCFRLFSKFIFWVLDIFRDSEILEHESLYEQHMDLIFELKNSPHFDNEIVQEFINFFRKLDNLLSKMTQNCMNLRFGQELKSIDY